MAHIRIVYKALKINRLKENLLKEKIDSIKLEKHEHIQKGVRQNLRHGLVDCRVKLRNYFKLPEHTCLYRFFYQLTHYGSLENYIFKSLFGFLGGFLLTFILFFFFVVQLNLNLTTATVLCSILGTILMIGLAFSCTVRCIVFLTLPQLFSKRGRQALLAYAFILTLTGPAKNTLNNMQILSESLACGQEQLKDAVKQILDVIKKPFLTIKEAIKSVVKTVKEIVKKIKEILIAIKRIILTIVKVIKSAYEFLGKIFSICNKEIGTPFQRCTRVFENAILECNAKLGPYFSWLCSITYLVKSVCYIVKIFDYVCALVDIISDNVVGVITKKVKTFVRHMRTMFYVRIKFSHSFQFKTESSKKFSEIAHGIMDEIKEKTKGIMAIFQYISCATTFFFLFIIIKVIQYRYKYLTSDSYDNKYIMKDFRIIDINRAKNGKETVLPLNHREINKYISLNSIRLVKSEKKSLAKATGILLVATLKLSSHLMADYMLYWIMELIRYHGRFQSKVPAPNMPTLNIEGEGLLADLLKSVVKAFKPLGANLEIDTIPCLPTPIPPDYDRYIQIGSILILLWILTIVEPYGLRIRQRIMSYYYPFRARQRSIWLYNQIMRSRLTFVKFARRQLKRKFKGAKGTTTHITFGEWIRAKLKLFRLIFGNVKITACVLCGQMFRDTDEVKPVLCKNPGCPGIYCDQCFNDIHNLCSVCLSPVEYGDLSDISLEKGSSDEEIPIEKPRKKRKIKYKETSFIKEEKEKLLSNGKTYKNDSDSSSDYLSDYQFENNPSSEFPHNKSYKDIEKQSPGDYANMDHFNE